MNEKHFSKLIGTAWQQKFNRNEEEEVKTSQVWVKI